MSRHSIKVSWSDQDDMFVAVCPALGDLSALGNTAHAAVAELEQAIELALETYAAEGWPVPESDVVEEYSGQFRLRLPRSMHSWLVHEAERQGVSLNSFATSLLAQARGSVDTHMSLASEINTAFNALRATLVATMRSAMVEMAADSSTSWNREAQPAVYEYEGSPTSTLKLVESAR
jgi:predicted HicB family RNase H-like nuclease